jgi:(2Fe-2S) ferredoxin
VVVYPDGIWYHHVDEAALERIYQEHILGDHPVEELIFHRLYPAGQEPAYPPEIRGEEARRRGDEVPEVKIIAHHLTPPRLTSPRLIVSQRLRQFGQRCDARAR